MVERLKLCGNALQTRSSYGHKLGYRKLVWQSIDAKVKVFDDRKFFIRFDDVAGGLHAASQDSNCSLLFFEI
jgi:hypothetical protein